MFMSNIRNFSIIAHIDHGKSTLADRMLEITNTIEKRKMKEQFLDSMELERERGITIKMQPVRMVWNPLGTKEPSLEFRASDMEFSHSYILNLIDTPGHIDFYYEVSRALKAVEGCILLVDSTQGVQAQTLTTLGMAKDMGLVIIPVLSKIDSPLARVPEIKAEVVKLLSCDESDVLECSGKTGQGVKELLREVVKRIPPPKEGNTSDKFRGLIFDFKYSNHRGVIVYLRPTDGRVSKSDVLTFIASKQKFIALEVGVFAPVETPKEYLERGEIGYIVTGIKQPGVARVGDTITDFSKPMTALGGFLMPSPVVWASIYPESQDDFTTLRQSLDRLRLSDSSFTHEEESSGTMGRGFRCGFLGMLHLEIITERLRREFGLNLIVTTPSISYEVEDKRGKKAMIYSPSLFPPYGDIAKIREPWVSLKIISPPEYLGGIMQILFDHEAEVGESESFGETNRVAVESLMPLREMMRNFFDQLKSASSGFASLSYNIGHYRDADVTRLDIVVADEIIPAFTRVVSKKKVQEEAEKAVEKLFNILPRQMFVTKIQGVAEGRILSSKTLSALRKDVTGYLYGGDITRKMKLLEKQKKGKKKMKSRGKVNINQDVFIKMMK
ncbi:MAG: elongation factor 4 [Candidatus Taylorbacteria bacterium RIFCSPLOWO2_12_FULL_43_20]|uniref:Elongation factor 4 n=1 Tax=Candidatus Taylorbacteria bacterium RIFCSPLOWO2_12_FULL_43_20 TaxID=1802332 RepID=A0A1G2P1X6_9BACT|nr:MAG: elongation factor 4 [Candidatus Taylorbacteria bacterium RIFCSPHIGHO2_01_FULL_43_120]OHA29531.1 MAG: elongation factor 4 [Candidatus Taylorbacteria bacterium RIFCSPHIGHO2_12_FULL_42_34]OHA31335.1 MAG: elongation factor 4 [Candidatus Taylorbacteria bacterium RIFCSPLOWO2_01_FULL_43_83]OHA38855.1 MAG: elongation factor 4 [Candidatus Taylorbacteria bacterium RIFCSPLOWO2_02_FULL_43_22b]OHA42345.1 MAG: elongation factor 4 [Candidatus Taylorbacteria bacterium RIFCSPLOWO2_12_FULL_43_20]